MTILVFALYKLGRTTQKLLDHVRLFNLGFGKASGALSIARFSWTALSGRPRRFRS
jgi:hypothetical protein